MEEINACYNWYKKIEDDFLIESVILSTETESHRLNPSYIKKIMLMDTDVELTLELLDSIYLFLNWLQDNCPLVTLTIKTQNGMEIKQQVSGYSFNMELYKEPVAIISLYCGMKNYQTLTGIETENKYFEIIQ